MRALLVLAAGLLLAACDGDLGLLGTSGGGTSSGSKAVGTTDVTVTRNKVRLVSPVGFCVDPVSTKSSTTQAFVVFGNCAAITGNPEQPQPYVNAIATATVTSSGLTGDGAVAPQVANLNSFFRTSAGRTALSRKNDPETVTILRGFTGDGTLYLHVTDTSPTSIKGAQNTYWRAYFDSGNSVVAMSVMGLAKAPVSSADGLDTLRDFVTRNRRAPKVITTGVDEKSTEDQLLDRLFP